MEGSPARWAGGVVLAVIVGLLGLGLWSQSRGDAASGASTSEVAEASSRPAASAGPAAGEASGSPEAEGVARAPDEAPDEASPGPEPEAVSSPSPLPEVPPPPVEPGPATGPWPELAPAAQITHPDTDPYVAGWYDLVGYFQEGDPTGTFGGNPSGDWTNKAEIWDQLAGQLQSELEARGAPSDDPVFPGVKPGFGRAQTRWSTKSTEGRGEFVEFLGQYENAEGEVWERALGALVVTEEDGRGRITAVMPSFDLRKEDYGAFFDYVEELEQREWDWITTQPPSP